jgi:hypothetical protein
MVVLTVCERWYTPWDNVLYLTCDVKLDCFAPALHLSVNTCKHPRLYATPRTKAAVKIHKIMEDSVMPVRACVAYTGH